MLLAIVILATSCLTTEGNCGQVCTSVCKTVSTLVCKTVSTLACSPACSWVCSRGRRRREILPQNTTMQIRPFPDMFGSYDRDMDGMIDLEEFSQAVNADEHAKGTQKVFNIADENGDGEIDCTEFKNAPYLFGHRPAC